MYASIVLLAQFFLAANCVKISADRNDNNSEIIVINKWVSDKTLAKSLSSVYVLPYEDDTQIETVSNLRNLQFISFANSGQEIIPEFYNVPNLTHINLENNSLLYVKGDVFNRTSAWLLVFSQNQISRIEKRAFSRTTSHLYLSCNKLRHIRRAWFVAPSALQELLMDGNLLEDIPQRFFKDFTSLNSISLAHNRLNTIGPGAFGHLNFFGYFFLNNNNLTNLKASMFMAEMVNIAEFRISFNNLTFLSEDLMEKVVLTGVALIQGNPWQCSCYDKLNKWIPWDEYGRFGLMADREGEPRCIAAQSFSNDCVPVVDRELIQTFAENSSPPPGKDEYCDCKAKNGFRQRTCI